MQSKYFTLDLNGNLLHSNWMLMEIECNIWLVDWLPINKNYNKFKWNAGHYNNTKFKYVIFAIG